MAKLRPETIVLKGKKNFVEGSATAVVKPGQAVAHNFAPAGVGAIGVLKIVTENDMVGKTIEDSYAIGEQTYAHIPARGDVVFIRVPAGADAIAQGDILKHAAGGNFVGGGVAADAVAEAAEALDNSGGTEEAFIRARVI